MTQKNFIFFRSFFNKKRNLTNQVKKSKIIFFTFFFKKRLKKRLRRFFTISKCALKRLKFNKKKLRYNYVFSKFRKSIIFRLTKGLLVPKKFFFN